MVQRRSRYLDDYEPMTKSEAMEIRPSAFPVLAPNTSMREPPPDGALALVVAFLIVLTALVLNG